MRKTIISLLLVAALILGLAGAVAEIDFSEMSLDELLQVQEQLNAAIDAAKTDDAGDASEVPQSEQPPALDSSGYTEMSKGSKGDEVKALQKRLFDLGYYSIAIDGDYGNGTVNAIKAFEEAHGLEQTGVASPEFQALLFSDQAKSKPVPVSSIKIAQGNANGATALVGGVLDVAELVSVSPENATEKGLSFALDNEEFAQIDENGILTAKAKGNVTVTITSRENIDKPKSATLKVKVRQPVKSITLGETEFNVGNGSTHQMEYTVNPDEADDKTVNWTSDNPSIATVSKNGSVKGVDTGTTTITCTANDGSGASATASVTVITVVKKVAFDQKSETISVNGSTKLVAKVTPENATDTTVKWRSSNTDVATVDAKGKVSAKKSGSCVITAEANDGTGASADITIYVEPNLPVMVNSITWQTTWGQKNGKIGVQAENLCVNKTIKSFDCIVVCTSSFNTAYDEFTYEGPSIKPGKTEKSKLTKQGISGFTSAYKVEITPIKVYFTDGTEVSIDKNYQYTSTFMM